MTALKTQEISVYRASVPAPANGHYVIWMAGASYPIAVSNTAGSTQWRRGAQLVPIDYYAGPLPERSGK